MESDQMPKSMKAIVCINGSRTITNLDLDRFIDPSHVGCVVTGGAAGADSIAEQ